MKRAIVTVLAVLVLCAGVAPAADEIDAEMLPVVDKVKSRDAAERDAAVVELVGLREAISDALKAIVADANAGHAPDVSKADALYLMTRLRLVQCIDVVNREKDWTFKLRYKVHFKTSREFELFQSGRDHDWPVAIFCARDTWRPLRGGARVVPVTVKADLSKYPVLQGALSRLRSGDWQEVLKADKAVRRWYQVVCRSMNSVINRVPESPYSDDVKIAAAYLVGEFRMYAGGYLSENIDIKDELGLCANYPSAIAVDLDSADSMYPCAVGLVKVGCLVHISSSLSAISRSRDGYNEISTEGCRRLARVLMVVNPEAVKAEYQPKLAGARSIAGKSPSAAKHLSALESVADIIR
ncbi:MAG: hypothetical protein J7M19_05390 [Planctomycetes bacterium]|nr:hypothetical protein [Planctomycetota bacterium]